MIKSDEKDEFFAQVNEACKKAIWCAIATVEGNKPRVRIVHPTWEGDRLWFATGPESPKAIQMRSNPNVDVQYQVAPPDFTHIMVRGTAEKDVTDALCEGHFPGHPVMPGVLITEAMAQLAAVIALSANPDAAGEPVYLLGTDKMRFRKPVTPGDVLVLEVELVEERRILTFSGTATVNGKRVATGQILAAR